MTGHAADEDGRARHAVADIAAVAAAVEGRDPRVRAVGVARAVVPGRARAAGVDVAAAVVDVGAGVAVDGARVGAAAHRRDAGAVVHVRRQVEVHGSLVEAAAQPRDAATVVLVGECVVVERARVGAAAPLWRAVEG